MGEICNYPRVWFFFVREINYEGCYIIIPIIIAQHLQVFILYVLRNRTTDDEEILNSVFHKRKMSLQYVLYQMNILD